MYHTSYQLEIPIPCADIDRGLIWGVIQILTCVVVFIFHRKAAITNVNQALSQNFKLAELYVLHAVLSIINQNFYNTFEYVLHYCSYVHVHICILF